MLLELCKEIEEINMFGNKLSKKMLQNLLGSDEAIEVNVKNMRTFLNSFQEDRKIGSITDDEIREYSKAQVELIKKQLK